ncbi:MAG: 2Fe-2S iron-sulfur cluster-binding protein [Desulfobacterota bacterium]|nr:2Fe-2S iron-sulfur cluster-binding protein [Thermodesulfobacteriota bacterium]MDW8002454.1 2Fe-2S iron-sulfur cluster-binding protein [Deltaproteobacteria bacterium]
MLIDGKEVRCESGENLLKVALRNGIYIPNLCFIEEEDEQPACCRLCFVEIEGEADPKCACTTKTEDGMRVTTKGERAYRLQKTAFELIMSNHPVDCGNCGKNGVCELQKISKVLRIRLKTEKYQKFLNAYPIDRSSRVFIFDPNKCVQCGKCVYLSSKLGLECLSFAYRGFKRRVTTFLDAPIGTTKCGDIDAFVRICPVGAFTFKGEEKSEGGDS